MTLGKSGKSRDLTNHERMRLANPVTFAAMEAAQKAGRDRYDGQMNAVVADIQRLLAGRSPRALTGAEAVELMSLSAEFDRLAIQQKHCMPADLQPRLDPDEGTETVDA